MTEFSENQVHYCNNNTDYRSPDKNNIGTDMDSAPVFAVIIIDQTC